MGCESSDDRPGRAALIGGGCTVCGCYRRGRQDAAEETYAFNLLAAATLSVAGDTPRPGRVLDELESALKQHARWRDWPEGDDHMVRGED